MTQQDIFTDKEIEQIRYKKNLDYGLSQVRIMTKVFLYTSFASILFIIVSIVLNGLGVV